MLLSCIIVNFNQTYFLRLCIDALRASTVDFDFEIIVVDNGSHNESVSFLKTLEAQGKIRLIHAGKNLGYGKGNNLGVRHAKGEYVLILNPDVSVEPDLLAAMAKHMKQNPEVGILAPQLYFYNDQIQDSCRRFMKPLDLVIKRTPLQRFKALSARVDSYTMADFNRANVSEVDMVTGACFMIKKSIYEKLGGFDPRFFMFMEDVDVCRRVWEAGLKVVYFPQVKALHYHKRLSGGSFLGMLRQKMFWAHCISAGKYFWKWRGRKLPTRSKENEQ